MTGNHQRTPSFLMKIVHVSGFIGGIHATSLLAMGLICPTRQIIWVTAAPLTRTEIFSHHWLSKVTDD